MTAPDPSDELIDSISAIRDILIAFRRLIADITKISNKYDTSPSNFGTNLFTPDLMAKAAHTMPPERLGLFMSAMLEAAALSDGLQNFTSYDTHQMKDLQKHMDVALEKFNQALRQ